MKKLDILLVEDERSQREMLADFLRKEGHQVFEAEDGEKAVLQLKANAFDLAVVDYKMPRLTGLDFLKEGKKINPEVDVVMVTAFGTIDTAVEAMKAGAADYLTKPIDLEELLIVIERIAEHRTLLKENEILRRELSEKMVGQENILYRSPRMAELINLAGRVAKSNATVLIQGESGTGKDLFARLIHHLSPRANRPMITVNCAALPETLIESELFGHERGSFTGAVQRRIGRFEQADSGTLFLDEIGEVPPAVQVKLLRFLQEGEYERLGGDKALKADVRVISATNRDLQALVKEARFREDLFFRLNVIPLKIPPLRERRNDIPVLLNHFVQHYAKRNAKPVSGVSHDARDLLMKYDYPGNVRELENIIERAVVISRGPVISLEDLPFGKEQADSMAPSEEENKGTLRETLEDLERRMIQSAMEEAGSNQSQAAARLGLSERMLRYKLKKYDLKGFGVK
ncbi:MAG: sigma-54-dependent Fis family transcriptional regulator [Desulfobacteraceae bacterium]|nr:MAG: sigma-54-dependent Fis family transcriptional regulator [Desulfobacteraceae bacterium]